MQKLLVLLMILLAVLVVALALAPPAREGAYVIAPGAIRYELAPKMTAEAHVIVMTPMQPLDVLLLALYGAPVTATPVPAATVGALPAGQAAAASATPRVYTSLPPGSEVIAGAPGRQLVALTFDGGAGATHAPAILDALSAAGVRATMFVTGRWAEQNPALVRRMLADGHELANHSYSHANFTALDAAGIALELERAEQAVNAVAGMTTRPFFRPPFGARDVRVLTIVAENGYIPVLWTLDSGDWQSETPAGTVLARVSLQTGDGTIVVSHLDAWQTAQVLPETIRQLRARGYALVTVGELIGFQK